MLKPTYTLEQDSLKITYKPKYLISLGILFALALLLIIFQYFANVANENKATHIIVGIIILFVISFVIWGIKNFVADSYADAKRTIVFKPRQVKVDNYKNVSLDQQFEVKIIPYNQYCTNPDPSYSYFSYGTFAQITYVTVLQCANNQQVAISAGSIKHCIKASNHVNRYLAQTQSARPNNKQANDSSTDLLRQQQLLDKAKISNQIQWGITIVLVILLSAVTTLIKHF